MWFKGKEGMKKLREVRKEEAVGKRRQGIGERKGWMRGKEGR